MARWTGEQILEAIRSWLASGGDGRQLSYRTFRSGLSDAERRRYPTPEAVNLYGGGWDAVMTAVGGPTRRRRWTPAETVEAVQGWAEAEESRLTATAYVRASRDNANLPGAHVLARQIGGWRDVLAAIGGWEGRAAAATRPARPTGPMSDADEAGSDPTDPSDPSDPVTSAGDLVASRREVERLAYRDGDWPEGADRWAEAAGRYEDRLMEAAERLGVPVPRPRWPTRRPRYDRTIRAMIEDQLRSAGLAI
ncbi:MAG: hypothetical protein ACRD29_25830 [Acidimicrobiales bacterium]